MAMENTKTPTALILSRQNIDMLPEGNDYNQATKGAYVVAGSDENYDVIMLASGSEVSTLEAGAKLLREDGIKVRIVSVPSEGLFRKQSKEYQNQVLPKGYKRMVLEFSNDPTMYKLVKSDEDIININRFGKSGTEEELLTEYELDIPSIVIKIKNNI